MADVRFKALLTKGVGVTGKPLGPLALTGFQQNGVELQFQIGAGVLKSHRDLKPVQWSGPQAIWKKNGPILQDGNWELVLRDRGAGADDPLPSSVKITPGLIAFWDSPGPQMTGYVGKGIARVFAVQNFTAWIEGAPVRGGKAERLCEVASWHSVVDIVSPNWDATDTVDGRQVNVGGTVWERMGRNEAGPGWVDVNAPPPPL